MRNFFISLVVVCLSMMGAAPADAIIIYGNSASYGDNPIHIIDSDTGVEQTRYIGQATGNGRGMVVVGDTMYYTVVNDSKIYEMNINTGVTTGFIQTSNSSMSTLAWDGSTFWTTDYSGTNRAFQIDTNGINIKTITLSNASNYMDGMEFFNDKLIANRVDAGFIYDIYDLDGNVLQADFINTGDTRTTGIAYDGTDFWVSNLDFGSLSRYDGLTGAFIDTLTLSSDLGSFLIEDISVDYAERDDTGGKNPVPEPSTWILLGTGLAGLAFYRRRKSA